MLFPDRFLEQVEPLQHPEAEASAVVEVADSPEAEQLLLLQEEQELQQPEPLQEPLQPEPLQELLQAEPLQEPLQPEETLQRNRVKPKLRVLPRIQLSPVEPQRTLEQRMAETMQRNRVKP